MAMSRRKALCRSGAEVADSRLDALAADLFDLPATAARR
jgi:hypothetical protein